MQKLLGMMKGEGAIRPIFDSKGIMTQLSDEKTYQRKGKRGQVVGYGKKD